MMGVAAAASDEEVRTAAAYFSNLKLKPWIKVIETDAVPKTQFMGWMLLKQAPALSPSGNATANRKAGVKAWRESLLFQMLLFLNDAVHHIANAAHPGNMSLRNSKSMTAADFGTVD